MKNKEILTFVILIAVIISIIFLIQYVRGNGEHDEETIICIAEKAKLIVSPTCSACAKQKQILKDGLSNYDDYLEILSVTENPDLWEQYDLIGVPTWIIGEKTYAGVRTISELKELTEC